MLIENFKNRLFTLNIGSFWSNFSKTVLLNFNSSFELINLNWTRFLFISRAEAASNGYALIKLWILQLWEYGTLDYKRINKLIDVCIVKSFFASVFKLFKCCLRWITLYLNLDEPCLHYVALHSRKMVWSNCIQLVEQEYYFLAVWR